MSSSFQLRTLGGKEYAVGIFWQMLSHSGKSEIATLGQQLQFDLYIDASSKTVDQAGFCSIQDGARAGLPSLAMQCLRHFTRLHDKKGVGAQHFIVALDIGNDEWYLLVVNDGVIQPDTDCLLSIDKLIERVVVLVGSSVNWDFVVGAPALQELQLPGFAILESQDSFKHPLRGTQLRIIRSGDEARKRMLLYGVGATLALGLVGGGGYWWMEELKRRALLEEQARQAAIAAAVPPPPPWRTVPSPQEFLNTCLTQLSPTLRGGWSLEEFSCDGKETKQSWSRGTGNLALLALFEPDIAVDTQNQKATRTKPLGKVEIGGGEEPGPLKPHIVELVSLLQQLEIRTAFAPPQNVDSPAVPVKPAMRSVEFSVDSDEFDPREFIELFPFGTRLTEIEWKPSRWKLKGIIYAYE